MLFILSSKNIQSLKCVAKCASCTTPPGIAYTLGKLLPSFCSVKKCEDQETVFVSIKNAWEERQEK